MRARRTRRARPTHPASMPTTPNLRVRVGIFTGQTSNSVGFHPLVVKSVKQLNRQIGDRQLDLAISSLHMHRNWQCDTSASTWTELLTELCVCEFAKPLDEPLGKRAVALGWTTTMPRVLAEAAALVASERSWPPRATEVRTRVSILWRMARVDDSSWV